MRVKNKTKYYDAVKYQPGMEEGFLTRYHDRERPTASSGLRLKDDDIPIQYPHLHGSILTDGDWILTDEEGDKFKLSDDLFWKNCEEIGEISDGYHTFNELYYHRMILFSVICNQNRELAWKSMLHADGTMYEGYFIVGITTPEGNYTYHFEKKYWDKFDVPVLSCAPVWDGHKAEDIGRLESLVRK
jgi:hypothetical protein